MPHSLLTALLLSFTCALTVTTAHAATPAPMLAQASSAQTEIRFDNRGRPVIATMINQSGPYFLAVDTAAETSLLVPQLGEMLKLTAHDSELTINGATGSSKAQLYAIDQFSSALFHEEFVGLLVMPNGGTTNAAGIIGMDLFAQHTLYFDLQNRLLKKVPSGSLKDNFFKIKASGQGGTLLRINVKLNGIEIPALVDSGAAITLANAAAVKALGWNIDDPRLEHEGEIGGATNEKSLIKKAQIDTLALGPLTFKDIPVRFTTEQNAQQPELILGSDLLNHLMGYALDFPNGEFLIQLPEKPNAK